MWFPVACGVLVWLLVVPMFAGDDHDIGSDRWAPKPSPTRTTPSRSRQTASTLMLGNEEETA